MVVDLAREHHHEGRATTALKHQGLPAADEVDGGQPVCPRPADSSDQTVEASGPRQARVSVISFSEKLSVPPGTQPANPA
ncbi:hypothetical protein [Streptomyces sp. NPDC048560]|uniref:hypothetical protein n=1 Tax=Streptomyces sp. NPDC048560 TaxID=3155488 RepID=UPI0034332CBB